MRLASLVLAIAVATVMSCDTGKFTVGQTAKILERAQPGLQQESDYELARQAIPGALKTVEGFWVVDPDNKILIKILTEGYCQYGTAFVEDDWEDARLRKDLAAVEYHNVRASNIFTRCLNFALRSLGDDWKKHLFGNIDDAFAMIKRTGADRRTPMMFAGMALGSIINHNLTRVDLIAYLPLVQAIEERVIELDKKNPPANLQHRALPYVALGMVHSARPKAMGGDPEKAKANFEMALEITKNPACGATKPATPDGNATCPNGPDRFLLARTLMAFQVGKQTNDRKFFHDQLKQVLLTPPSVWPEQRLANEVAHRKARRYLSKEKEIF